MRRARYLGLAMAVSLASLAAWSETPPSVDLFLVLLVDISGSLAEPELALQRQGYVEALADPAFADAIAFGPRRAIAIAYVEWAGPDQQHVVLPCTVVTNRDDAMRLSRQLASERRSQGRGTSISAALVFSLALAKTCPAVSPRVVIDVSGNGPNNAGPDILLAREKVIAAGATINGLPLHLLAHGGTAEHVGQDWLKGYYESCVSGGPGAFVLPVNNAVTLRTSILRKIVLEIAMGQERLFMARGTRRAPFHCYLIGQVPGR